jgi:tRNA (guanine9-N1)-methyltransferase
LIDRNKHKNLTFKIGNLFFKIANELGIKTAKFPLLQYTKLKSSTVLTVDQCFQILLNFFNTNNRETSIINSIPKRKIEDFNQNNSDNEIKESKN